MSGQDRLPFVQFELAGTVGLEQGRYLGSDPERVLVVSVAGAPTPPRRRLGRVKPKDADRDADPPTVPLTTLTVVRPDPLGDEPGAEREVLAAPGQDEDLAVLAERRSITGQAANEALGGELGDGRMAEVTETLRLCERVLRRRRALG